MKHLRSYHKGPHRIYRLSVKVKRKWKKPIMLRGWCLKKTVSEWKKEFPRLVFKGSGSDRLMKCHFCTVQEVASIWSREGSINFQKTSITRWKHCRTSERRKTVSWSNVCCFWMHFILFLKLLREWWLIENENRESKTLCSWKQGVKDSLLIKIICCYAARIVMPRE